MADRLSIGVATRSYPGLESNGDSWVVRQVSPDVWRVAVIDGVGHGEQAEEAALVAQEILNREDDLHPTDYLQRCHEALHHTRGAVASVARIDLKASRLTYCGIGNIEARLRADGREERLLAYRGILGAVIPRPRSFDLTLGACWLFVLHSDGVSGRLTLPAAGTDPQAAAEAIVAGWGRETDDATVMVVAST